MSQDTPDRPPAQPAAPRSPDWVGLAGAAATVVLHFVLQSGGPNPVFIIGACCFWAGFVAVRALRDPGVFRDWGFRADNLARASAVPAALFAVAAAAFAVYGGLRGPLRLPAYFPLLLLLYPAWGIIQQFLTLGVVLRNLERVPGLGPRRWLLLVIGPVFFGLVHASDPRLVAGTFALELVIIPLYFRHHNLWPLGVLHGWVGALFYLWVLDRDLWAENFAGLLLISSQTDWLGVDAYPAV